jgi:pSer/pThr/pTyr-binding forkhead associated (FHA) protein
MLVPVGEPSPPTPKELPAGPGKPTEWIVVVHPLTPKAAETLPDEGLLVTRFPLRIGRVTDPNEREALDLNDLWLLDKMPYYISRNHCEIDVGRHGPLVRDRGSYLGCVVNDKPVGGGASMSLARLNPGDNILVIGSGNSPYQFRVFVSLASAPPRSKK